METDCYDPARARQGLVGSTKIPLRDKSGRVAEWHGAFLTYCGKTESNTYPWPAGAIGKVGNPLQRFRKSKRTGSFASHAVGRSNMVREDRGTH